MGVLETSINADGITQKQILKLYLPLALSWLFMAIESPISVSIITSAANSEVNLAAFTMLFSLTILFESPVIDLLSTSTTFGRNRQNYIALSKFAWMMIGLVTAIHSIVSMTPLYWVVTEGILQTPHEAAAAARVPMIILSAWAGFVGWRRYLHGLMIRAGVTKPITIGTFLRVVTVALVGFTLLKVTELDGLVVAACSLFASVIAETMFIHVVSRRIVARFATETYDEGSVTTVKGLFKFHVPLTGSTFVMILSMPLVTWALNQSKDPIISLAAWQVASTLMWLFRSAVFALPEAVIALYKNKHQLVPLWSFCLKTGIFFSLLTVLTWATGLDRWFFSTVLQTDPELVKFARLALIVSAVTPIVFAAMSCVRGFLTAHHITSARLWAISAGIILMICVLLAGNRLDWIGVVTASIAITIGQIGEFSVLFTWWRRSDARAQVMSGLIEL